MPAQTHRRLGQVIVVVEEPPPHLDRNEESNQISALAIHAKEWSGRAIGTVTRGVSGSLKKARGLDINLERMTKSRLAGSHFSLGHPVIGTVYAENPAVPGLFYPLAPFHSKTFEHKFGELMDLLMSLGAREMTVEHERGWGHDLAAALELPITVKGSGEAHRSRQESRLFTASLDGKKRPELPVNLAWFHDEPTWQALANGRLQHGLKEFDLKMRYEDDYGIDVDLSRKVRKLGLKLGGDFHGYESTVWRVNVVF